VLSSDGQYSLSIVMSYCSTTHQIYAISCNLTGRYGPSHHGDQYRRGLYRYDLSIHVVIHTPFARKLPAKSQALTRGEAARFRLTQETCQDLPRARGELARSQQLQAHYPTQICNFVGIGIGCALVVRQPCRADNYCHKIVLHSREQNPYFHKIRQHQSTLHSRVLRLGCPCHLEMSSRNVISSHVVCESFKLTSTRPRRERFEPAG
jgi:hypothetical protein